MYDSVHELGRKLNDSRPHYDELGNCFAPKIELSKEAQNNLESQLISLAQLGSKYLDQCGMRMPKPLWRYERKKPETHWSDPQFKYAHLVANGFASSL